MGGGRSEGGAGTKAEAADVVVVPSEGGGRCWVIDVFRPIVDVGTSDRLLRNSSSSGSNDNRRRRRRPRDDDDGRRRGRQGEGRHRDALLDVFCPIVDVGTNDRLLRSTSDNSNSRGRGGRMFDDRRRLRRRRDDGRGGERRRGGRHDHRDRSLRRDDRGRGGVVSQDVRGSGRGRG